MAGMPRRRNRKETLGAKARKLIFTLAVFATILALAFSGADSASRMHNERNSRYPSMRTARASSLPAGCSMLYSWEDGSAIATCTNGITLSFDPDAGESQTGATRYRIRRTHSGYAAGVWEVWQGCYGWVDGVWQVRSRELADCYQFFLYPEEEQG